MTEPRARASHIRADHGKCLIVWQDDQPLDRWHRSAADCRTNAQRVRGLIEELQSLIVRCQDVLISREAGDKFWRRLEATVASLERVVSRDEFYADELDRAAALEVSKSTEGASA